MHRPLSGYGAAMSRSGTRFQLAERLGEWLASMPAVTPPAARGTMRPREFRWCIWFIANARGQSPRGTKVLPAMRGAWRMILKVP